MPTFKASDPELYELLKRSNYTRPDLHKSTERFEMQIRDFYCHDIYIEKGLMGDEFQTYYSERLAADDDSGSDGEFGIDVNKPVTERTLNMAVFGTDRFGNSVTLNVKRFAPHIYVKTSNLDSLRSFLNADRVLGRKYRNCYRTTAMRLTQYYGSESKPVPYVKVEFNNANAMRIACKALRGSYAYKKLLYETNLNVTTKFIHSLDLDATGWVSVEWADLQRCEGISETQFEYYVDAEKLKRFDTPDTAPSILESYDLEATTDDGKFQNMQRAEEYIIQNSIHLEYAGLLNTTENLEKRGLKRLPQILLTLKQSAPITKEDRIAAFHESARITDQETVQLIMCKVLNPDWVAPKKRVNHLPNMIGPYSMQDIEDMISEPIVVECTDTEELLLCYAMIIRGMDVDIRTGYNIFNYDELKLKYDMEKHPGLYQTCCMLMSRIKDHVSGYYSNTISSSGMGENIVNYFDMPGRVTYDTMKIIQRGFKKYNGYSLDFLLATELKMHKVKFSTNDIIDNFNHGGLEQIKKIGVYCMHDSFCTQLLTNTLKHVMERSSLGKQSYANLRTMFINGQAKPLHSVNVHEAHKANRVFDVIEKTPRKQYNGGTVFDPKTGIYIHPTNRIQTNTVLADSASAASLALVPKNVYYVDGVFVLDFNSLYPSVIREYNLSQDTIYGTNPPPNPELYQQLGYTTPAGNWVTVYVKYDERRSGYRGTLPRVLDKIMATREKYKELSKNATLKIDKEVYDAIQNACKVQNNSLFGVSSDNKSPIYHEHMGPLITYLAGKMLVMLKEYTQTKYPFIQVIYGDTDSNFNAVEASPSEPDDDDLLPDHPYNLPPHQGEPYESPNWKFPVTKGFMRRLNRVIELGKKLEKEFNQWLITEKGFSYIGLKYEKTFPLLYMQIKKHYAGPIFVDKPVMEKFHLSGLPQVRRETPDYVRVLLNGIMYRLLCGCGIGEIAEACKVIIKSLFENKIPLDFLQMSTKVKPVEDYKNVERMAFMVLTQILRERDFMNAPRTNDRLSYVYIKIPSRYYDLTSGHERKMPDGIVPKGASGGYKYYLHRETGEDISPDDLPKITDAGLVGTSKFSWRDITLRIEETEQARQWITEGKVQIDYDNYIKKSVLTPVAKFIGIVLDDEEVKKFLKYILSGRASAYGSLDKYLK